MEILSRLIDSESKAKLLSRLMTRPDSFSVSELSRLADLSKASVSVIVKQWGNVGLVLCRQQGRNKLVSINKGFYLLPELKKIFEKTRNFQKPLLDKLQSLPVLKNKQVKAVIVFGSRSRNDFLHASDFDVLIGLENKNSPIAEKIVESFVEATKQTGVRFSPALLDKKDIKQRWKEKDKFILNVLTTGKILKGAKWLGDLQATS
ncbi:MAG: nucleotidyltransferase domain-containing protein [archaeon]|nr:nucleotidyltransferase domain-containing protein [archaeon]